MPGFSTPRPGDASAARQASEPGGASSGSGIRLGPRLLLQAASLIAKQLREQQNEHGDEHDDSVSWQGEAWKAAQFGATGPRPDGISDIYSGPPGIALFLAAHARLAGDHASRDLALRACAPYRRLAREAASGRAPGPDWISRGLGGLVGLGAPIYCLAKVGQLLDEPALLEEAHAATALLTSERIAADREHDITFGSAGAILALLALGDAASARNRNGRTPLQLAEEIAAHLVQQRSALPGWPRAWHSASADASRCGFGHGATGICVALALLARRLGWDQLRDVVVEGLSFERRLCEGEPALWRPSPVSPHRMAVGWCYGAAGIAIGRLAILDAEPDAEIAALAREDLARALATLRARPPIKLDHLCCGNTSHVEALLHAHERTGDEAALQAAHALALHVLRAAKTRGGFTLGTGEGREPSLFQGLAGVGYALLRLAAPDELPCVLRMA